MYYGLNERFELAEINTGKWIFYKTQRLEIVCQIPSDTSLQARAIKNKNKTKCMQTHSGWGLF